MVYYIIWMMQNNKLHWVVGGASVLGISYLIYHIFFKKSPPDQPTNIRKESIQSIDDQRLRTVHSNYSQFYFDKEEQLRQVCLKISAKGPTVQQIFLLSPAIIVDQYIKYTRQIRKRRRLIRKVNEDQYINLIRTYQIQIKQLMQRGRNEILQEYGLSEDDLVRMVEAYEMFQDSQALKKKAFSQLKQKSFNRQKMRKIPKDKLKKIIQQQISFITSKMYDRLRIKLQDGDTGITQQQIFKVIVTLCDDIIYEKYGYQREEIEDQLKQVPSLTKQLKKYRQSLFANMFQFNIDSIQSPDEDGDTKQDGQRISAKTSQTGIIQNDSESGSQS